MSLISQLNTISNIRLKSTNDKYLFDPKDYKFVSNLGAGGFGLIDLVKNIDTGKEYIMKTCIYQSNTTEKLFISREIRILILIQHPTIIQFRGFSYTGLRGFQNITILMDYKRNGSLSNLLELERKGLCPDIFDDTKKQIILIGIARGMIILHSYHIIHRDLKPENILLDDDLYPRITDFGLSKFFNAADPDNQSRNESGTVQYMAPEVISSYRYNTKADVYSFGILMYEILTGKRAYYDLLCGPNRITSFELKTKVKTGYRPDIENEPIKKGLKKMIEKCWSHDPQERPNFKEIYQKLSLSRNDDILEFEDKLNEPDVILLDEDENEDEMTRRLKFCLDNVDLYELIDYVDSINQEPTTFKGMEEEENLKEEVHKMKSVITSLKSELKKVKEELSVLKNAKNTKTNNDNAKTKTEAMTVSKIATSDQETSESRSSLPKMDDQLKKAETDFEKKSITLQGNQNSQANYNTQYSFKKFELPALNDKTENRTTVPFKREMHKVDKQEPTINQDENKNEFQKLQELSQNQVLPKTEVKKAKRDFVDTKPKDSYKNALPETEVKKSKREDQVYKIVLSGTEPTKVKIDSKALQLSSTSRVFKVALPETEYHCNGRRRPMEIYHRKTEFISCGYNESIDCIYDSCPNDPGILQQLKLKEKTPFDRLFIITKSTNDIYNLIDPDPNKTFTTWSGTKFSVEFELEEEVSFNNISFTFTRECLIPSSFDISIDGVVIRSVKNFDGKLDEMKSSILNSRKRGKCINLEITTFGFRGKKIRFTQTGPNLINGSDYLEFSKVDIIKDDGDNLSSLLDKDDIHKSRILINSPDYDFNLVHLLNAKKFCFVSGLNSWFQIELTAGLAIISGFRLKRCQITKMKSYKIIASDDISKDIDSWTTLIDIDEKTENEHQIADVYQLPNPSPPVKFIRIVQTGPSWNGKNEMQFYHFDIFGTYVT
ncbi:hypothetical protein M9Y10_020947 [Tritrichomonas musculus]|uniref:Protein kinase domain-containing protein n=1 Tax=Tritrichomonas musculus TaxID=1915356 RepID=A0ABR2HH91_9EUKA